MPATWTAVVVTAQPELADSIASFLFDQGAPGLETEDLPDLVRITAHFHEAAPADALRRFCDALLQVMPSARRPDIRVEKISDTDWSENWKSHFPPLAIGDRLFVHPPWIAEVPPDRVAVVIDPGMAFGTGHHPSTRGGVLLLERTLRERTDARVLDIGTGSGVLAIAAAKLGANDIWAVDIDPEACAVAARNVSANHATHQIEIRTSLDAVPGHFEIIVANLFSGLLINLATIIHDRLTPGGAVIAAGILSDETDAVTDAWNSAGLRVYNRHEDSGWITLAATLEQKTAKTPSRTRN